MEIKENHEFKEIHEMSLEGKLHFSAFGVGCQIGGSTGVKYKVQGPYTCR